VALSDAQRARYARHLSLAAVGESGQERLASCSVLVVGAGGLGSPCLLYLAAAGVGRLGIVDDDQVEVSNLQRQILHGTARLGAPKVESARERLGDLNPEVRLQLFPERLTAENALDRVRGWDVVVDGTDNFATRYVVDAACEILGTPLVYGAIQRFEGQVSVFHLDGGPGYRDLFPDPPPPELAPSCAEAGVLGVLPGVIGTLQATEVLKVLLGVGTPLSGRLLVYDALSMRMDELRLQRDPARSPPASVEAVAAVCADTPWRRLPAREVARRLDAGWAPFVLDVRTAREARVSELPGTALRVPHEAVGVGDLPAGGEVLLYCRAGGRSARACRALLDAGVPASRLVELEDGLEGWARTVDPDLPVG
jgi:sulfur-carrier protein adenylyltransferase/sulfurtransferase